MSEKIKILIVEDSELDIEIYQDAIKNLNEDNADIFEIVATFEDNKIDGLNAIKEMKDELSGAFIDLKLKTGEAVDINEGNDIINEIYGKLRFPVFVLTNTPGSFNGNLPQSLFLQVVAKTDIEYDKILKSLVAIHQTGIIRILGRTGLVEQMLDNIFWKNISATLEEWIQIDNCEKPLLRYALTHLQEHLEISEDGSEFDIVYPIENYIKPSIKKYFFTGDIINKKDDKAKRYVILTPACDLAPHGEQKKPKATHIILSEIEDFKDTPTKSLIKRSKAEEIPGEITRDNIEAKQSLSKLIRNDGSPKYYYLPDTKAVKGGLINFQRISNIKVSEFPLYEKEATISVQFVKDIISKFSFYYSRQGSPDFDYKELVGKMLS